MTETNQTPNQRLRETLRRNAELVEALPGWARSAVSVDAVFSLKPRSSHDENTRSESKLRSK